MRVLRSLDAIERREAEIWRELRAMFARQEARAEQRQREDEVDNVREAELRGELERLRHEDGVSW